MPRGAAIARPESFYGCVDMAGAPGSGLRTGISPNAGNTILCDAHGETYKVMRGGANFNDAAMTRTTHRYYLPPNSTGGYYVGFRCVKDVE